MKRGFVDTPEGQIHYRTEGEGSPLLALHQVPMSSSEFNNTLPILGQNFWAIAIDFPLFGDSYKTTYEPEIADFTKAVLNCMDCLDIEKAHIVGHHTGACVAVELATQHPARVEKLVLSGCPSWSHEEGLKWIDSGIYKELSITPDGWFMRHIWEFTMERIPEDRMDAAYELALDYMKAGIRAEEGHRAAFSYDILPKLSMVNQPTLVMCGDKDLLFPHYENTLKCIPHAKGHVIKGGPAQTPRLFPQEWAQAVAEFLVEKEE